MDYLYYSMDIMGPLREKLQNKYVSFSIISHVMIALIAWQASLNIPKNKPPELITIELSTPKAFLTQKPIQGVKTLPTQGLTKAKAVVTPKPIVKAQASLRPLKTYSKLSNKMGATKTRPIEMPKKVVALNPTINDLDENDLDQKLDALSETTSLNKFDESELSEDFKKVEDSSKKSVEKVKNYVTQDLDNSSAETETKLSGIEKQNSIISHRASSLQKANSAAYAKAIGEAEAAERAQSDALLSSGSGEGSKQGSGRGATGDQQYSPLVAGAPQGIRGLDQLKQMPGNARPQYSYMERLRGDQGQVIFWAYVNKEGRLISFKQVRTTGHTNLDQKTFEALRQWRFYPGQEGWVELPFKWDLKGGPQEMPTLLRVKGRNVSAN